MIFVNVSQSSDPERLNTYVSLIINLKKKIGKVFTSKFVGSGPSSYEKRFYRTAVSQRLRNTGVDNYFMSAFGHLTEALIMRVQLTSVDVASTETDEKCMSC